MEGGEYSLTGRCFDIGNATRAALSRFARTGDPFAGDTGEGTAGNSSLMRLAPVVLHALHDPAAVRRLATEQSRLTHAAPQTVEGCVLFADLLRRATLGEGKKTLLAPASWDGHPAVAAGAWRERARAEVRFLGLRDPHAGDGAVGGAPHGQLRGGAGAGGEPRGRCRHGGCRHRAARRRAVRPRQHPGAMAGATCLASPPARHSRCAAAAGTALDRGRAKTRSRSQAGWSAPPAEPEGWL